MEGIANFISMLDYVLDTKRKRHITGGLLLSGALLSEMTRRTKMSKASTGFAFVAGLTIGAAGAWYYLKDKYAKLAEEEIASVKAAYAKHEKPTTEEKTVSLVNAAKNMDKGSITEYTQRLQEAGYKDYSRTIDEKPSGTPGGSSVCHLS